MVYPCAPFADKVPTAQTRPCAHVKRRGTRLRRELPTNRQEWPQSCCRASALSTQGCSGCLALGGARLPALRSHADHKCAYCCWVIVPVSGVSWDERSARCTPASERKPPYQQTLQSRWSFLEGGDNREDGSWPQRSRRGAQSGSRPPAPGAAPRLTRAFRLALATFVRARQLASTAPSKTLLESAAPAPARTRIKQTATGATEKRLKLTQSPC